MDDIFVPLFFITAIPTIFWVIYHFRHRKNQEIQITLRAMIEKGHQLSPELLASLGNNVINNRAKDLRRGVILISIGISITILALFIGEVTRNEESLLFVGFSGVFIVMGLTYIGFWKFMPSNDKDNNQEVSL